MRVLSALKGVPVYWWRMQRRNALAAVTRGSVLSR